MSSFVCICVLASFFEIIWLNRLNLLNSVRACARALTRTERNGTEQSESENEGVRRELPTNKSMLQWTKIDENGEKSSLNGIFCHFENCACIEFRFIIIYVSTSQCGSSAEKKCCIRLNFITDWSTTKCGAMNKLQLRLSTATRTKATNSTEFNERNPTNESSE